MVYQSTVRLLAAKRVPLIRFRKGGLPSVTSASSASAGSHGPSGQTASSSSAASARVTIGNAETCPYLCISFLILAYNRVMGTATEISEKTNGR